MKDSLRRFFSGLWRAVTLTFRVLLIVTALAVVLPLGMRAATALWSRGYIYSVETVPERRAALVFGARIYRNGRPSAMLADRVAAAADLYHRGKVEFLLMTGDGRAPSEYDEPDSMRRFALELGVPDTAILLDKAGNRTYDSCYRAKTLYGVADAVVVTQNFHLDRTLMTCRALGIDAVGVAADYQRPWGYSRYSLTYSRLREIPATVTAALDLLTRPEPRAQ
jgi:SanA protein